MCKDFGMRPADRLIKAPAPIKWCDHSSIKGENMARAPNYNHERRERDRQKAAKKAEKAAAKAAKSERTKEETAVEPTNEEA
jgi:hypothetical protein